MTRRRQQEDAAILSEFWALAERFDRSLCREWKDHWDERSYDEYIVVTEGRLPYGESLEQYVCRMETRREITMVLALCTEKQQERFLLYALYDLSYEEVTLFKNGYPPEWDEEVFEKLWSGQRISKKQIGYSEWAQVGKWDDGLVKAIIPFEGFHQR